MNKRNIPSAGMIRASQAAKLLGVSTQRLRQLSADGYVAKAVNGNYGLVDVIQGYIRFLKDDERRAAQSRPGASLASARERETRLRIAAREAEIVDAVDAERFHKFSSRLYREAMTNVGSTATRDPIIASLINAQVNAAVDRFDSRFREALPKLRRGDDPLSPDRV